MKLHIFWDNSNIWLAGKAFCAAYAEGVPHAFRINFVELFKVVTGDREIDYAYVCGSIPPESDMVWQRMRELGVIVDKQVRSKDNKEVAVDELIQKRIAERLLDVDEPGILLLLSGDGKTKENGDGFITSLERAVKRGWKVEIWSWDISCSRRLRAFAEKNGRYVSLDNFYEQITMISTRGRAA